MRTTVVIGAGRGMGAATARSCARRGDAVVLVDSAADDPRLPYAMSTAEDLDRSLLEARSAAGDPEHVVSAVADATSFEAVSAVIAGAEEQFGRIDAIVVTTGVIAGGVPLWEMATDQLHAVVEVNLGSVIVAARAGIPALLRTEEPRQGRFLAVASTAASRGLPMLAGYGAAKAGVVGLIRGLAAELRGTGITANSVSPGSTDTLMLAESARLYGLADAAAFAVQQPIERLIRPEEVATVIAWLVGPDSGAITGADHVIDGGLAV